MPRARDRTHGLQFSHLNFHVDVTVHDLMGQIVLEKLSPIL